MTFYNLGHVVGAKGEKGEKGDNAPLSNLIQSENTTQAVTGKAVTTYVQNIIGNIEEDMME